MTDLELITQPCKQILIKLECIDRATNKVCELQGRLLDSSLNIDSSSDIRRTISLVAHLTREVDGYFASRLTEVWLNQMFILSLGVLDKQTGLYRWFPLGRFLLTNDNYLYDATNQQVTISAADLMVSLIEERGSQVGSEVVIKADSNMQDVMEQTANRFFPWVQQSKTWGQIKDSHAYWGENQQSWTQLKYGSDQKSICDFKGNVVPYDLEFEQTAYPYDFTKKIVNLWPCYEQYIDVYGVYTVKEIPTGLDDEPVLLAEDVDQLVISDSGSCSPKSIKNTTEIWGKEIDADYTAESCDGVSSPGIYELFFDSSYEVLEDGFFFTFTPDVDSILGQKIQIQDTQAYSVGKMDANSVFTSLGKKGLKAGIQYAIKYTNHQFVLQGESKIHVMCLEYNAHPGIEAMEQLKIDHGCENIKIIINRYSSFSVEKVGILKQVLKDGDYDNIYTTELAYERASLENWNSTRAQENVVLSMIYVPWLDVNQKITYKSIITGNIDDYLVKRIVVSLVDFTMEITLTKFYPYYPWLRKTTTWGNIKGNNRAWKELRNFYWDEILYPVN